MKYLSVIVVIFIVSCRGQEALSGRYYTSSGFVGRNYIFKSDSTFTVADWSCTGIDTGAGRYVFTEDSLILHFDSIEISRASSFTVQSKTSGTDSCWIKILCAERSEPLPFVIVGFEGKNQTRKSVITDLDGHARLRIAATDFPVTITCKTVGLYSAQTTIDSAGNYELNANMSDSFISSIPGGTVERYGIRRMEKNGYETCFRYKNAVGDTIEIKERMYRSKSQL